MKTNNGFTLIELMIVIAIIAIVSAIAIPAYTGYLATARMVEAKNNIAALKLAEEEYYLEHNGYCSDISNDNTNLSNACDNLWTVAAGDNGVNFTYTISASGNQYKITATGDTGTPVAGKTDSYQNY